MRKWEVISLQLFFINEHELYKRACEIDEKSLKSYPNSSFHELEEEYMQRTNFDLQLCGKPLDILYNISCYSDTLPCVGCLESIIIQNSKQRCKSCLLYKEKICGEKDYLYEQFIDLLVERIEQIEITELIGE